MQRNNSLETKNVPLIKQRVTHASGYLERFVRIDAFLNPCDATEHDETVHKIRNRVRLAVHQLPSSLAGSDLHVVSAIKGTLLPDGLE